VNDGAEALAAAMGSIREFNMAAQDFTEPFRV
jgi:hypothetical protein